MHNLRIKEEILLLNYNYFFFEKFCQLAIVTYARILSQKKVRTVKSKKRTYF